MNKNYRNGRHTVYELRAHIVLTPKYRKKVFTPVIHDLVKECIETICGKHNVILEEFNTDLDHAHLIINYPPSVCLSTFIGQCKGYSSRVLRRDHMDLIRDKLWGGSFWSASYFIASTGGAPLAKVCKYIQDQGREPRSRGNPSFCRG